MKKSKLAKTDSIQKLAEFWDTHDLADFEDQLQEVSEPVFARAANGRGISRPATSGGRRGRKAINVSLNVREVRALERMAQHKGVSAQELVRTWVRQRISSRDNGR